MKGEKTDYCVENVDYLGAAWWQEEKETHGELLSI